MLATSRRGQGRQHFAIAFEQAPHLPYIANNMAVLLTLGDHPDCKRALEILQPIMENIPTIQFPRVARTGPHQAWPI